MVRYRCTLLLLGMLVVILDPLLSRARPIPASLSRDATSCTSETPFDVTGFCPFTYTYLLLISSEDWSVGFAVSVPVPLDNFVKYLSLNFLSVRISPTKLKG